MKELSEKEMGAIAGGFPPCPPDRLFQPPRLPKPTRQPNGYYPWQLPRQANPPTASFGTLVEPAFELPGTPPNRHC